MDKLHDEIKVLIIESLNLEDMVIEDIDTDAPLFGDGLGLDSIDALELGLALKKQYQVNIDGDDANTQQYFSSVASLAKYISSQAKG